MNAPSPKVLLIEDEKQIRRFVRVAVEEEGCHVSEAETMAHGLIDAGLRKAAYAGVELVLLQELHNGPYFCQHESVDEFDRAVNVFNFQR